MKLAAYGFFLILLAIPFAAHASENLVAKRETCRVEARTRIVAKKKIEVDDYRRIVERRAVYISQCINRTVVARSNAPLPPQRVLDDAVDGEKLRVIPASRGKRRGIAGHATRYKLKTASVRTSKATKTKGRKIRLSARQSK